MENVYFTVLWTYKVIILYKLHLSILGAVELAEPKYSGPACSVK